MVVYRVADTMRADEYYGTREEARQAAKRFDADYVEIEQRNYRTDKEAILILLNGRLDPPFKVERRWQLSPRGGLREIRVEDRPGSVDGTEYSQ